MGGLGRRLFYTGSCLFELAKGVILSSLAIILIHLFVATIFIVDGISMEPNLATGEVMLVNRWSYLFGTPARGEIVVLRFPGDPERRKYVKRLIGLPNETLNLTNGSIAINNQILTEKYLDSEHRYTPVMIPGKDHWQLGPDEYFTVGDNRPASNDSRTWDGAGKKFLIGKAVLILWPPDRIGLIPDENYDN